VTRRSVSKIQEDNMQLKPVHGAAPDRTIDMDLYRRRIAASRCEARGSAALTSAWAGVLAMIAIYLALFFAAEQTRTSNRSHAAVPMVAMPNAPDILF
jgi:hypothetical protein